MEGGRLIGGVLGGAVPPPKKKMNFHQKMVGILVHSRMTFYVYAKIGQVNGGHPPRPLDPRCYISEMVKDSWVHAARRLTSIEFSFDLCNIYCDGPRGVGYPADERSVGDSHPSCCSWMSFLLQYSAKDIHWNSSFLQPPTDS